MNNRGEISKLKVWLLVLVSLFDEAILLVIILLALNSFHVKITWPIILVTGMIIVIYFFIIHKAVIPSLRRRKMVGTEDLINSTGTVTQKLRPEGMILIKGEYWKAISVDNDINIDEEVEVVGIKGLVLEVKRKTP